MSNLKNSVEEALKQDDQRKAIELLLQSIHERPMLHALIIQSGQLHSLDMEYVGGRMKWEEMRIHKNQISSHILNLLDKLDRMGKLLPNNLNAGSIHPVMIDMMLNNNPEIKALNESIEEQLIALLDFGRGED